MLALPQEVVGDPDHRGVVNGIVSEQEVLDLLGGDLLAAAVDLVLRTTDHRDVSVRGEPDDVAGAVEAVGGEAALVVLGRPVVSADGVGAAGEQVPGFPVRDIAVLIVDDADLVIG